MSNMSTMSTNSEARLVQNTLTDTSRSMLGARGCRYPDSNYGR